MTTNETHEGPDTAEITASPDLLSHQPGRGRGVRRLNRVPLFIVGGVGVAAIAAIAYTVYQRKEAEAARLSSPPAMAMAAATALPPVNPGDAAAGPPKLPPPGTTTAPKGHRVVIPSHHTARRANTSDAEKQRRQLIQRIEAARVNAELAALTANNKVSGFGKSQRTASVAPAPFGLPGKGPGLLAARDLLAAQQPGSGAAMPLVPPLGGQGGGGYAGLGGAGGGVVGANGQSQKAAFLNQSGRSSTLLDHTRRPAVARTEITAGTVIPGVMISGVDSDLPGEIIGQVRRNVYDSATGKYLLIPAGSRLVGTYDSQVTGGQTRVLVGWKRIIFPDSSSLSLGFMPGQDQSGYAGFHDEVNDHTWEIFKNALLLSIITAGVQLSQPQATNGQNINSSQIVAGSLGQQFGQVGTAFAQRGLNIQPTLKIRPGYDFNIMVTKDIVLPPWTPKG